MFMKSDKVYLLHIRDSIHTILQYTKGFSANDFYSNSLVRDAVIRNFEIIGEASKRISKTLKDGATVKVVKRDELFEKDKSK